MNTFSVLTVFKLSVPRRGLVFIRSVLGFCLRVKLAKKKRLLVTIGVSFRPHTVRWELFVPSSVGFYVNFPPQHTCPGFWHFTRSLPLDKYYNSNSMIDNVIMVSTRCKPRSSWKTTNKRCAYHQSCFYLYFSSWNIMVLWSCAWCTPVVVVVVVVVVH